MFNVIIPLRSGSKGLKNKNISTFGNESLVNCLLNKITNIRDINKIYILTDSKSYKQKIKKHKKVDLSYHRPKRLSLDNSNIYDLVSHFIKWESEKENKIKNILLLQVTSPLLNKKEIEKTILFIKKKKIKSLFHVCEIIENPNDCIKGYNKNWSFLSKKIKVNRQNYDKYYFITGSLYFFTKNFFLKYKKFYKKKSIAYKVDKINFIDIDTNFDLALAKAVENLKIRN